MIYYNANKFGRDVEDCAIRSLSVAEGISWDEAYQKLSDYARERGLMINSVESIEKYLDEHYSRMCIDDMTVGEFAECFPYGTYLVTMPRTHRGSQTVGNIIDSFDPSKRVMWCAWKVDYPED